MDRSISSCTHGLPHSPAGGGGAGVVVEAGLELEDKDICQHRAGIWSLTMPGIELQAFH